LPTRSPNRTSRAVRGEMHRLQPQASIIKRSHKPPRATRNSNRSEQGSGWGRGGLSVFFPSPAHFAVAIKTGGADRGTFRRIRRCVCSTGARRRIPNDKSTLPDSHQNRQAYWRRQSGDALHRPPNRSDGTRPSRFIERIIDCEYDSCGRTDSSRENRSGCTSDLPGQNLTDVGQQ